MASIVKDVGEIWTRLFDHRPFIQGEVTFFLKQYQDKRNDREIERLFKIIEHSTDIGQSQLDRAVEFGGSQLPSLKANVDVALSMCERVLQREGKLNNDNQLKDGRELRKVEWQRFINEMSEQCQKVDQEFFEKEKELKEYYVDLERKLHIAPMFVEPIKDHSLKIKPTAKLIDFVAKQVKKKDDVPENIIALKSYSKREETLLSLKDVKWLNSYLEEHRKSSDNKIYLHELLEGADINLPEPSVKPRNPELVARLKKLQAQQNAREYASMTKGINPYKKVFPEDSISAQMKEMNKQLIAVAQFIFSVLAGFAFGFLGVELIVGDLDFGFRLLLGIIISLIIALAEIYFLAKKLSEDGFEYSEGTYGKVHQD